MLKFISVNKKPPTGVTSVMPSTIVVTSIPPHFDDETTHDGESIHRRTILPIVDEMTRGMTDLELNYYNSLNDIERMAMVIAKDHLSTSFCLFKTIGFKNFISKMN
jgi:hypothetical protein